MLELDMEKNIELCVGSETDFDDYFQFLIEKVKWFEQNNIDQWTLEYVNRTFSKEPNKEYIDNGQFFVLKIDGKVSAGCIVKHKSKNWADTKDFAYIINLVGGVKGAGKKLIEELAKFFKSKGMKYLRLVCRDNNKELREFYKGIGFTELDRVPHSTEAGVFSRRFNMEL